MQMPLFNICLHLGCGKMARNKIEPGYCRKHLARVERHGCSYACKTPRGRGPVKGPYSPLFVLKRGHTDYWGTVINGETKYVHRVVAEHILGRPLHPGEMVHHRDRYGLNNHPDNLEVMFQSDHMRMNTEMREARRNGGPF
jgi:hypothetical protein